MPAKFFKLALCGLMLMVAACSSNPPAPVIDRIPSKTTPPSPPPPTSSKPATPASPTTTATKPADWRPDSHVVKKGDTLISIGLEYGYDYKEIAEANGLVAPYTIRIGQTLKLGSLNDKSTGAAAPATEADGVVITPIKSDTVGPAAVVSKPATAPSSTSPVTKSGVLVLAEPKAIREIYTEEAYKKVVPGVKPVATAPATPVKPETDANADKASADKEIKTESAETKEIKTKPAEGTDEIDWLWPTKGKVVGNFSENGNKGLDIGGVTGQSIVAAAGGKVIYSGSDLRGYGKLVIIKHSKNYLSVYAHNSQILVKEGQQVSRGQKIAEMGNSDSSSVKLHFEIRRQGKSVDPVKYLAEN
jgi:lipoprotein NlpD